MTKQLTIIRHAKSSHENMENDHARTINDRGKRDCKLMGQFMAAQELNIEHVYCSTAKRARSTLELLNSSLQITDSNITYDDSLYLVSLQDLMNYIAALPNSHSHVAIVGHNPGFTQLCNFLTDNEIDNLPTCGACLVQFEVDDWKAIARGLGQQKALWTPRVLKEFLASL